MIEFIIGFLVGYVFKKALLNRWLTMVWSVKVLN